MGAALATDPQAALTTGNIELCGFTQRRLRISGKKFLLSPLASPMVADHRGGPRLERSQGGDAHLRRWKPGIAALGGGA